MPARVVSNANAGEQAAENIARAASTDEGAEVEVGTVKKVLLVPTPTTSVLDETAEAPRELRSGVLSIVGIDDEESGDPAPETDISLQSSTGVQFRQIKPERRSNLWASSRIHDGVTLSEDSWGSTTLRKTSIFARFVAPMSTAFRSVILVATTRRFFMLIIFGLATMMPSFQWIEYSIVSSLMQRHYHVSGSTICWTSMIFHVGYITSVFPCAWILDNYGLRVTVVCSCCLTVIGSCIKLLSVATDRFSLVLIGQAFPAYATAFTATVPTRLASAWFKYDELSAASAAAMLGPHFGTALGFFVPPHVVNTDNVERSLRMLCIFVAVMSCLALLVTIVAFDEKPEHPLSFSEILNLSARTKPSLKEEMHSMLGDRYFILLLVSYGLNVGCLYSILTLLNPIILTYFPDEASFAGLLGLSIVSSGVLGSWVGGIVVDKTSMFKEVTLTVYVCSGVALLLFAALVPIRSHTATMIVCLFLGFFMIGYIPLGMQLVAEMTYPHSEWLPACFLGISAQGVGLVLIPVCAFVQDEFGVVAANGFMTAVLVIGCLMTAMLRAELKRQHAFNRAQRNRPRMFPPPASDRISSIDDEQPEL
ncbi:choline/ethanolamine transporter flvcr2a-like [Haemaphysalis longicornis]